MPQPLRTGIFVRMARCRRINTKKGLYATIQATIIQPPMSGSSVNQVVSF